MEGLHFKRPIQCLASSKILTPPTPSPPGECVPLYPPPLVRGGEEDTLAGWRGEWGATSSEDARHCSILYICKGGGCAGVRVIVYLCDTRGILYSV